MIVAWCIVFAGVAVLVLSALAAVALPTVFERLHLLTATTSLGTPVIGLGLLIITGVWSAVSATVAVKIALVVVTAPVTSAATGRLTAQREGLIHEDIPA